ncbi:MAG: zinc-binding dehydrogenase, partial [Flavobacteriaceae bacterium]
FIPATSGTAGQGALKLAKDAGAIVIGTTRTPKKKQFLMDIGADHIIVTQEENIRERLMGIVGDKGIQFAFDPIGNTEFNQAYMPVLTFGGNAAIYGLLSGEFPTFPVLDLVRRNTTLHAYSMFNHVMYKDQLEEGKKYVLERIAKTGLKPIVDRVFPFMQTVEAYQYMLSGKQKGKIVVRI